MKSIKVSDDAWIHSLDGSANCKSVAINSGGHSSINKKLGGVEFSVYLMRWMSSWNKTSATIAKISCQALLQCCLSNLPNKKQIYSKASNKLLYVFPTALLLALQAWTSIHCLDIFKPGKNYQKTDPTFYIPQNHLVISQVFFPPRKPEPWHRYGYSATW